MTKVLIYNQFDFENLKWFQQQEGFEVLHASSFKDTEPPKDADALIIRSGTRIDDYFLNKQEKLKLIVTSTSGFDHIDLKLCKERGIRVCYTPEANARSAAELTWGLALACARNFPRAQSQSRDGNWKRQELTGLEMAGGHYGIIGLGRVGSRVAKIAQAFEMKVSAFDPYQEDQAFEELGVTRLGFEELVKSVDVLSIHVPRSKETENMFGQTSFEYLKRGLIFINTSRGSVLDEQGLLKAVDKGWIAAAGLDVFAKEPLPKHSPLLRSKQIICTPHIGARTEKALKRASEEAIYKVIQFFQQGQLSDELPPKAPWVDDTSC